MPKKLSEGGRKIKSDILEESIVLNIDGLFLTVDIKEGPVNYSFLILVLETFGFGNKLSK